MADSRINCIIRYSIEGNFYVLLMPKKFSPLCNSCKQPINNKKIFYYCKDQRLEHKNQEYFWCYDCKLNSWPKACLQIDEHNHFCIKKVELG